MSHPTLVDNLSKDENTQRLLSMVKVAITESYNDGCITHIHPVKDDYDAICLMMLGASVSFEEDRHDNHIRKYAGPQWYVWVHRPT